ncbi:HAMP domain-containing sensor histidine kinase [Chitinophaga sp. LS1]|uniref:sensor histidine kinase n=1 Tax=Chitinophaga sp. LS1 TaxID=3051176 RepID=UPI002AAAF8D4|nr:HAMP domain-containing sensor histidine kinase [Chitinophaga sp. LS1]WPV70152.1 HAMP domain-containing sensor histidine kinase [Chitinophaga sp. LS1]
MKNIDTTSSNDVANLLNNASNIIAITSHEFKTPLTAISASVELLAARLHSNQQMDAFYEKNLSRITTEIFRLNNMLDEMLTINTIMSGRMTLNKQIIDVVQLLITLRSNYFADPEDTRSFELIVSGIPQCIYADYNQLNRIFVNLVSNAFKFSREKAPVVEVDFEHHQVVIRIIDDGIGIPADDLPQLFQPFFRASNVNEIGGTGLGLSIVKTFVQENNGTITVNSVAGEGSTFTLTFLYYSDSL